MSLASTRRLVTADVLKLRRNRGLLATALALSVGTVILYFAVLELRHEGRLGGAHALTTGSTLLGMYFGSFAAILVGTEAGTMDSSSGVFRDLVATGRSRAALVLARVPAAVLVAVTLNLAGFVLTSGASVLFRGPDPAPDLALVLQSAGWVVLATVVTTSLAVGVASLTRSRALSLTSVIALQTIVTGIVYSARFLGSAREAMPMIALTHLRPGVDYGSRAHPGSPNALPGYELPMPTVVAVLVLLAWAVVPVVVGVRHTVTRDP